MKTLALIGVGKWGKNIVSTLETIPDANLKYLSARDLESLSSYGEKHEKVSDWHVLLKKKDLDAVLIATPPSPHCMLIESALKAGKHVFVEKPMVLSSDEAKRIQKLVASTGNVFMVGYQYLFNDNIRYIKKEIEKGTLGKILSVKSEHIVSPSRPDVNIFWDAGPHPLSVFQYLFNPQNLISAEGSIKHDRASIQLKFSARGGSASGGENASSLEIIAACFGQTKVRKLTVTGEKATAVLDETLERNKLAILKDGTVCYPEIDSRESLRNELEHFIRCIQTGSTPLTDIHFGCRITEWLETISKLLT